MIARGEKPQPERKTLYGTPIIDAATPDRSIQRPRPEAEPCEVYRSIASPMRRRVPW